MLGVPILEILRSTTLFQHALLFLVNVSDTMEGSIRNVRGAHLRES